MFETVCFVLSPSYLEWMQPHKVAGFICSVPLRALYLLFSLFPRDLRVSAELICGGVDRIGKPWSACLWADKKAPVHTLVIYLES